MSAEEFNYYRAKMGLTQKAMAKLLNASQRSVETWCQGTRNVTGPTAELVRLLAEKRKIPPFRGKAALNRP